MIEKDYGLHFFLLIEIYMYFDLFEEK